MAGRTAASTAGGLGTIPAGGGPLRRCWPLRSTLAGLLARRRADRPRLALPARAAPSARRAPLPSHAKHGRPSRSRSHSPEHPHHFLVHLPGNESLQLDLTERAIDLPRLPPALDGLSIVHLSDLHFTGRVGKAYFQEVVRLSNELEPDLVAITGDLVDRSRHASTGFPRRWAD